MTALWLYLVGVGIVATLVLREIARRLRERRRIIAAAIALAALTAAVVVPFAQATTQRADPVWEASISGEVVGGSARLAYVSGPGPNDSRANHSITAINLHSGSRAWSLADYDTVLATSADGYTLVSRVDSPDSDTFTSTQAWVSPGGEVLWTSDEVTPQVAGSIGWIDPVAASDGVLVLTTASDGNQTTSPIIAISPNGTVAWSAQSSTFGMRSEVSWAKAKQDFWEESLDRLVQLDNTLVTTTVTNGVVQQQLVNAADGSEIAAAAPIEGVDPRAMGVLTSNTAAWQVTTSDDLCRTMVVDLSAAQPAVTTLDEVTECWNGSTFIRGDWVVSQVGDRVYDKSGAAGTGPVTVTNLHTGERHDVNLPDAISLNELVGDGSRSLLVATGKELSTVDLATGVRHAVPHDPGAYEAAGIDCTHPTLGALAGGSMRGSAALACATQAPSSLNPVLATDTYGATVAYLSLRDLSTTTFRTDATANLAIPLPDERVLVTYQDHLAMYDVNDL